MGVEIERKFLVDKERWSKTNKGRWQVIKQGYIVNEPSKTIRVRLSDDKGFITIKGLASGAARPEFEYEIPAGDAIKLLDNFCTSYTSKIRNNIMYNGKHWEVDEFMDENEGLVIAEIELSGEDEVIHYPEWIGKEVTGEEKYYNSRLSEHPYKNW